MSKVSERRQILQRIENGALDTSLPRLAQYKLSNPADVQFYHRCAALIFRGPQTKASQQLYARLIQHNPLDADAHFGYSRVARYQLNDSTLPLLQQASSHVARMSDAHQIKIAYSLGKANQDLQRYDDAFNAFNAGAQLHYRRHPFDRRANMAMLSDVRKTLSADALGKLPDVHGLTGYPTPIFILGMPRSGSTLLEQILTSHPDITGAGEVNYLKQAMQETLIKDRLTVGQAIAEWDEAALTACAEAYLRRMADHGRAGCLVTDKLPGNFAFVGLIRKLFPDARIFHTTRTALACIWSNFSTLFGDGLHYTYDLDVLAEYYCAYLSTMEHWRRSASESKSNTPKMIDVSYEDLVDNTEGVVRELINSLELGWSDECLRFFRNDRTVTTASVAQVRQPIYKSSLHTWQQYTSWLDPIARKYGL